MSQSDFGTDESVVVEQEKTTETPRLFKVILHNDDLNEVDQRMGGLFRRLESPLLTDLAAAWPGLTDDGADDAEVEFYPTPLPALAQRIIKSMPRIDDNLIFPGRIKGKPIWPGSRRATGASG